MNILAVSRCMNLLYFSNPFIMSSYFCALNITMYLYIGLLLENHPTILLIVLSSTCYVTKSYILQVKNCLTIKTCPYEPVKYGDENIILNNTKKSRMENHTTELIKKNLSLHPKKKGFLSQAALVSCDKSYSTH